MNQRAKGVLINLLLLGAPGGFIAVFFLIPVVSMLWLSVANGDIGSLLRQTRSAAASWQGGSSLPDSKVAEALIRDLQAADQKGIDTLARKLNTIVPGFRSLIVNTKQKLAGFSADPGKSVAGLGDLDPRWTQPAFWLGLRRISGNPTDYYLLAALDFQHSGDGWMVEPTETPLYLAVLWRTVVISAMVSALCLGIGYPVALWLNFLPESGARIALLLILVPLWTSLLVRSLAWLILLEDKGLVNQLLLSTGLLEHPLSLSRNRTGVLVSMTHILLPFMILSLYSVMRTIPAELMRAGLSLGASARYAMLRIYLPLSMPGVAAGVFVVFTLSLGYYITPLLIGGPADQMLSYFISIFVNQTVNWSMAAALSVILLALAMMMTLAIYRLVGIQAIMGHGGR